MRSSKRPQKKSPMHNFLRLTLPAALLCFLVFVHGGYAADPPDKEVSTVFDGFHYNNLSELSEKWNVRAGARLGPGANDWNASLIEPSPIEGKVRLGAVVAKGERKASGIGLKTPLPTTGTFAANVRFSGNSDAGYSSVKAFYTYPEKPLPLNGPETQNHLEHDFEIISEKRHCWLDPENVLELPVLKTITHEFTDPLLSRKSNSHNRNEYVSLSSIAGEYMTLVVQVKKTDVSPTVSRYVSTYTLIGKTGEIPVGETETCHPAAISHLMAMFNVWWFNPEDCANKVGALPSDQGPQVMDIRWFYYNRSSDIPPARVDRYGSLLDAGAPDTDQDGVPDSMDNV